MSDTRENGRGEFLWFAVLLLALLALAAGSPRGPAAAPEALGLAKPQ